MNTLFLFGVSAGEILIIFLAILMLFGSKKIPELARSLGKGINEFKKAADDIKQEFQDNSNEFSSEIIEDFKEIDSEIKQNSNQIRDLTEKFTDNLKSNL